MKPPPDFAIVGMPRSGTTALYRYLADHPGVTMSSRKEARFFSSDIDTPGRARTRAEYDALWADAALGTLRGEASPDYIQSRVAIPALLAERSDARLIAIVRNPLEIAAAHYANMRVDGDEDAPDFETAWRLQDRRLRGERLPPGCTVPSVFQYRDYAAVGDQLERFFAAAPVEQRLVVLYDNFRAATRAEYLRVLAFLGLPDDGRTEFAPANANRALRIPWLRRWPRLKRLNVRTAPRGDLRPKFKHELLVHFLPQIGKVERLLGRDLSEWKR
jgi:hypothetical protein